MRYKSFNIGANAKLRVREDRIVATVSSKDCNTIKLFVSGVENPWYLPVEDYDCAVKVIDYIWDR